MNAQDVLLQTAVVELNKAGTQLLLMQRSGVDELKAAHALTHGRSALAALEHLQRLAAGQPQPQRG